MTKQTDEELLRYFRSNKDDWYFINHRGTKVWSKTKVKEFWQKIRLYRKNNKLYEKEHFVGFIFPEFESDYVTRRRDMSVSGLDFWTKDETFEFRESVYFNHSTFLDVAFFYLVRFNSASSFVDCKFFDEACFSKSIFYGNSSFSRSNFSSFANYYAAIFQEEVTFTKTIFQDECVFSETQFQEALFKELILNSGRIIFQEYKQSSKTKIRFVNNYFEKNVFFRRCDIDKVFFLTSNIEQVNFINCKWNDKGRILLNDEELLKSTEVDSTYYVNKATYGDLEHIYRSLKVNFSDKKNWELSGKAFISEMKMRKKRLKKEHKYFEWLIFWFYGRFGGYTQNFIKPIISLLGLIGLFSLIYYFIDYNYLKALQRGVKGALPYFQIDTKEPFQGYWLILSNIEFLLGGTFITFFILALRKRFKQ